MTLHNFEINHIDPLKSESCIWALSNLQNFAGSPAYSNELVCYFIRIPKTRKMEKLIYSTHKPMTNESKFKPYWFPDRQHTVYRGDIGGTVATLGGIKVL